MDWVHTSGEFKLDASGEKNQTTKVDDDLRQDCSSNIGFLSLLGLSVQLFLAGWKASWIGLQSYVLGNIGAL